MKILSFDIEDWFHILDNESTKSVNSWSKFESRVEIGTDKILFLLEKHKVKATFFILGWIAEKYPHVVRKIANAGYEIGSHSHLHQLVYDLNYDSFKTDLEKSIKTLEDITGKKVISFRAPGFSIMKKNNWAFEVLHESGIKIDCSVFPAGRAHGGMPEYRYAMPSILDYKGMRLKEFPINTTNFLSNQIIFSGGGYFRLFPYGMIERWTRNSSYIMSYFHPRDFDYDQPILKDLSLFRIFKSYVGLKKSYSKLDRWLKDFDFTDLRTADKNIDWKNSSVIKL